VKKNAEKRAKQTAEQEWQEDKPFFYFIPAAYIRHSTAKTLPKMQELNRQGILQKMHIALDDAFRGEGLIRDILFVSHRWETKEQPDIKGVQLAAIKAHLANHQDIMWVWFDYSSMPQGDDRLPSEKAEFALMLNAIADLYLTARVLILLDGAYSSRFWTLTEAWCSMQTATSMGLQPAEDTERRFTISCIHNATYDFAAKGLLDLVSTKTPEDMHNILAEPDISVTNAKDKNDMLEVIRRINQHVKEVFTSRGCLQV
jgi:hypothetical protein